MSIHDDRADNPVPFDPPGWGEFITHHPTLRPPVIEGLLRRGETMNVISSSKARKSWMLVDLALSVATGQPWLGRFPTVQGPVLLIDNELHPETIAHRLKLVADARGVEIDPTDRSIRPWALRGRLLNMCQIAATLTQRERGEFAFIIVDAFYRTLTPGADENANADMAFMYNTVDAIAEATGAATALVHHASKGNQSEKSVTDVGSGAGAISRAVDTHLILRRHQEDGAYVLDVAVRSWPPVAPFCIRWQHPLWELAEDLDPADLWKPARAGRRPEKTPFEGWDAKRFAAACPAEMTPSTAVILRVRQASGLSESVVKGLLADATAQGLVLQARGLGTGGSKNAVCVCLAPPHPPWEPANGSHGYG